MDIALNALNPIRRIPFTRLPSTTPSQYDGQPLEADSVPVQQGHILGHEDHLEPKGLGVEDSKAVWHPLDLMALLLSLLCCAAAVLVIQSDSIAWRLGTKQQLTVVGLMISIMNLCLGYVAPLVWVQWEIRHGQSTLQNLDGLLRKTGFGPQMDLGWRTVLFAFTLLPLGLSLAYKQFFNGGASTIYLGESTTTWGMYPPSGLTASSGLVGTTLMYNATLPFLQATWNWHNNQTPTYPAAFGFNTLVLSQKAAVMMDTPKSSTVKQWQEDLDLGETRNVTADVYALMAQYNDSVDAHRDETFYRTDSNTQVGSDWWRSYANTSRLVTANTYNGWSVSMLGNWDVLANKDQSWLFLGVCPTPQGGTPSNLTTFIPYANMYTLTRVPCQGTWSISSGSFELVDGTCYSDKHPAPHDPDYTDDYQLVLNNNQLETAQWYSGIIYEPLARFANGHNATNQTRWAGATFATVAASMLWSRIVTNNGPGYYNRTYQYQVPNVGQSKTVPYQYDTITLEQAGMRYKRPTRMTSQRLTLHKGWALFFICAVQPAIILVLLIVSRVMYSTPVDRRFGLVALLAGSDVGESNVLRGAAFSGTLRETVRIGVQVEEVGVQRAKVRYTLGDGAISNRAGIRPRWLYE